MDAKHPAVGEIQELRHFNMGVRLRGGKAQFDEFVGCVSGVVRHSRLLATAYDPLPRMQ